MDKRKMSKRKRKRHIRIIRRMSLVVTMVSVLILLCGYLWGVQYYKTHFLGGTVINGADVSGMSIEDVEKVLTDYTLTIAERKPDGTMLEEDLTGDQIGIALINRQVLERIMDNQNRLLWFSNTDNRVSGLDIITYDAVRLNAAVMKIRGFAADFAVSPTDAFLSEYIEGTGYEIVEETQGNTLDKEKTLKVVNQAVSAMENRVDLDEEGCYIEPEVVKTDTSLRQKQDTLNRYLGVTITYEFDDSTEVVDGNVIKNWIMVDEDEISFDEEKVREFTSNLRSTYDTIFRSRTFKTSYGQEVKIDGGDYGWWMNYVEEAEALVEAIKQGQSGVRTPVYYQTAAAYGKQDYGNTYVEINLTAQHLFFYQDGKKILESDFVSGNVISGNGTPAGVYGITYTERNAMLVGEDYETPVSYWMPFNGNIGLHDAIWRNSFGGDLYKSSGSHGCVNLPYPVAKTLYSYLKKGIAVVCYELPGTEGDELTLQTEQEIAQSVVDAIDRIGTVTKDSWDAISRARTLYYKISAEARTFVTNYGVLTQAEAEYKELTAETKKE